MKENNQIYPLPLPVSENLGQVGGSTNIELEEEIESLTALSFKLGERREVKTQKTNEKQKVLTKDAAFLRARVGLFSPTTA